MQWQPTIEVLFCGLLCNQVKTGGSSGGHRRSDRCGFPNDGKENAQRVRVAYGRELAITSAGLIARSVGESVITKRVANGTERAEGKDEMRVIAAFSVVQVAEEGGKVELVSAVGCGECIRGSKVDSSSCRRMFKIGLETGGWVYNRIREVML